MTIATNYVKRFNTGLFGGPLKKQQCAPIELLPGEILLEIVENLPSRTDKLYLGMTVSTDNLHFVSIAPKGSCSTPLFSRNSYTPRCSPRCMPLSNYEVPHNA